MREYHKIQTVFKRDEATKCKTLLIGQYSLPEFEFLAPCEWVFTEKVDGTNIRVMWDGGCVTFGGKTDAAQISARLVMYLQATFTPDALRKVFGETAVCLYGEGYGAGIQKGGGNYGPEQRFVLFDVLIDRWWIKREDIAGMAAALGIDVVPAIGRGTLPEMVRMVEKGFLSNWGNFQAEGIVARPSIELQTRAGDRIITKIKHRDFVAERAGGARMKLKGRVRW